jgi:hypothetical protein
MILGFKQKFPWGSPTNFKEKILAGTKIHSIREDPHGRWKPGTKIHMAHGVRTKNYWCFRDTECCKSVQSIHINYYYTGYPMAPSIELIIDGELFYKLGNKFVEIDRGMIELAKNDGFDSVEDFFKWFDKDFSGKIIHWTNFRY